MTNTETTHIPALDTILTGMALPDLHAFAAALADRIAVTPDPIMSALGTLSRAVLATHLPNTAISPSGQAQMRAGLMESVATVVSLMISTRCGQMVAQLPPGLTSTAQGAVDVATRLARIGCEIGIELAELAAKHVGAAQPGAN